ncbi:MAG: T9SS type A sorting domain-containing protein [Bacteroidota bacterium]|nr:T9SS type A sorting domain-containing protein [Bacteroidota bacterium]
MKKFTILAFILILTGNIFAQIPNNGFENWNSTEKLDTWNFIGQITKETPSQSGNYAVKLQPKQLGNLLTSAIFIGSANTKGLSGGTPYTQKPDSIKGFFKYDLPTKDNAQLLILFKKNGTPINYNLFSIKGTNTSSFIELGFKLSSFPQGLSPDSVIIGISTSPFGSSNTSPNAFLIVDNLRFTGNSINQQIPNGNFESWSVAYEEPAGWTTSNSVSSVLYSKSIVTISKTTDKHSGAYAIKVQNKIAGKDTIPGIAATNYRSINNNPGPGFPVNARYNSFNGYYKYYPVNNDTAFFMIQMYKNGNYVGGAMKKISDSTSSYTYFEQSIFYNQGFNDTPDSALVIFCPSLPNGNTGFFVKGESALYADDINLSMNVVCSMNAKISRANDSLTVLPEEVSGVVTILWNTGENTQRIKISPTTNTTYTVTVTQGSCNASATYVYNINNIEQVNNSINSLQLFPVPANNIINVRFNSSSNKKTSVSLIDVLGNTVINDTSEIINSTYHKQIKTGNLPAGLYILKIDNGIDIIKRKIIIGQN